MQPRAGYIKSLKKIHLALLLGQCFLLVTVSVLLLRKIVVVPLANLDKPLQVAELLVAFVAVFGGTAIFKQKLLAINTAGNKPAENMQAYRNACIVRWAMIEAASLFATACFFLAGNYSFAALALALIVFFALQAPNTIKMMIHLHISEQEAAML